MQILQKSHEGTLSVVTHSDRVKEKESDSKLALADSSSSGIAQYIERLNEISSGSNVIIEISRPMTKLKL
jgi:hypothetical protein